MRNTFFEKNHAENEVAEVAKTLLGVKEAKCVRRRITENFDMEFEFSAIS
jgi:hypothetical protein